MMSEPSTTLPLHNQSIGRTSTSLSATDPTIGTDEAAGGQRHEWPVHVYRRTIARGWERYHAGNVNNTATAATLVAAATAGGKGGRAAPVVITASPKRNRIEIRQLKIRIHLFPQHQQQQQQKASSSSVSAIRNTEHRQQSQSQQTSCPNGASSSQQSLSLSQRQHDPYHQPGHGGRSQRGNGGSLSGHNPSNAAGSTPAAAAASSATVLRRLDTLLLSTRRGGAIVLKFRSRADCLSFSDRLAALNVSEPPSASPATRTLPSLGGGGQTWGVVQPNGAAPVDGGPALPLSTGELIDRSDRLTKRMRRSSAPSWRQSQDGDFNSNAVVPSARHQQQQQQTTMTIEEDRRAASLRSVLVRLLHDDDFMEFVDDVESCLLSGGGMDDCAGVLQALGQGVGGGKIVASAPEGQQHERQLTSRIMDSSAAPSVSAASNVAMSWDSH